MLSAFPELNRAHGERQAETGPFSRICDADGQLTTVTRREKGESKMRRRKIMRSVSVISF